MIPGNSGNCSSNGTESDCRQHETAQEYIDSFLIVIQRPAILLFMFITTSMQGLIVSCSRFRFIKVTNGIIKME